MSFETPKYSIIIPTFERSNLLGDTVDGCLLQNHDNFEILVSNNYSQDETAFVLSKYSGNPKIRIVETEKKLSMQDHFLFAMNHSKGQYILFLGDDDGVSPELFNHLDEIIEKSSANLIKFKSSLYYHNDWLGVENNTLHFNPRFTGEYFSVSIDEVIRSYCDFTEYQFFPNLLHSVFSRELFEQAQRTVPHMFVGAPDHSCPFILLAQPNARLCYVDWVLGYGGRSEKSNAAFYAAKEKGRQTHRSQARHTEWASEMTADTCLPHHEPNINVPGNFVPAAFSYAKFFFTERLKSFQLNPYKLSQIIQIDITNCLCGRRTPWHTSAEVENFRKFVLTHLGKLEQAAIFGMAGGFSFVGQLKLLLKKAYFLVFSILQKLSVFNIDLYRTNQAQRRVFGLKIDLKAKSIRTSRELVIAFDTLIKDGQVKGALPSDLSRNSSLQLLGCLDK